MVNPQNKSSNKSTHSSRGKLVQESSIKAKKEKLSKAHLMPAGAQESGKQESIEAPLSIDQNIKKALKEISPSRVPKRIITNM
jgi:hypothetical protein